MSDNWKLRARSVFLPLARALAKRGVRPDHLTYLGLGLSLLAALTLARGDFLAAAFIIGLSGLCDILDGDIARATNGVTTFGAFLDSTLDRVGEGALYAGLANFYYTRSEGAALWLKGTFQGQASWGDPNGRTLAVLSLMVLLLSFLVSYARARAEGLGLECKVGIMERPERMLTLGVGALLGPRFMPGALGILFLLTLVTVLQRVYHVHRLTHTDPHGESTQGAVPGPTSIPASDAPDTRR
jgi:CDP-diacylglycerol--glycerol-3-phosphate 3-phosphatidyltransferase